jgi:hypothetical protein
VVQSAGLRDEREAGRALYGSAAPRARRIANALRQRSNNASNVSVLAWQERIFVVDLEADRGLARDARDDRRATSRARSRRSRRTCILVASRPPRTESVSATDGGRTERELPARPRQAVRPVPVDATVIHDFAATGST